MRIHGLLISIIPLHTNCMNPAAKIHPASTTMIPEDVLPERLVTKIDTSTGCELTLYIPNPKQGEAISFSPCIEVQGKPGGAIDTLGDTFFAEYVKDPKDGSTVLKCFVQENGEKQKKFLGLYRVRNWGMGWGAFKRTVWHGLSNPDPAAHREYRFDYCSEMEILVTHFQPAKLEEN